jgi:hypothetical protein
LLPQSGNECERGRLLLVRSGRLSALAPLVC